MLSSGGGSNHTGAESLDGATAIDRRGAESEQTKKCEWKKRKMRRKFDRIISIAEELKEDEEHREQYDNDIGTSDEYCESEPHSQAGAANRKLEQR